MICCWWMRCYCCPSMCQQHSTPITKTNNDETLNSGLIMIRKKYKNKNSLRALPVFILARWIRSSASLLFSPRSLHNVCIKSLRFCSTLNAADGSNDDYIDVGVGDVDDDDDEGWKKHIFTYFQYWKKNSLPFKYDLIILELLPLTRH